MSAPDGERRASPVDAGWLAGWRSAIRRRWPVGVSIFGLVLTASVTAVLLPHPVHRATTSLRLGTPPPNTGISAGGAILGLPWLSGDPFANDLELLASRTLAEGVVLDAGLSLSMSAPRAWSRDSLFLRLEPTPHTEEAVFEARWAESGGVVVRRTAPSPATLLEARPGETVSFGGVRAAFRPWRPGAPRRVTISTVPLAEAVRVTRSRLQVERARREANVVEIRYDHTDAGVAAGAVTAAVDRFIRLRSGIQRRESGQTVDSLRAVAAQTQAELAAAEASIEELQRRTRLFSPEVQGEAFVERYSSSSAELERSRTELALVEDVLRRAGRVSERSEAWADLVSTPALLQSSTLGDLLARLTELENTRRGLRARRSEESGEVRLVEEQIAHADGMLWSLARSNRAALSERVSRLQQQVAEMEGSLSRLPGEVIELGRRQRTARILSEMLALTEGRLRQEELRQALIFSNVQVIDPPAIGDRPVWPRKKLGLAVGVLLAGAFAVLGIAGAEKADPRVRGGDEAAELAGAPLLAVVLRTRDGRPLLDPRDLASLRRAARLDGLSIAPVARDGDAAELVAAARSVDAALDLTAAEPIRSYAAAVAAADRAIALLTVYRRTNRADLRRAAALARQAGGEVAGVIVVCDRAGDEALVREA